MTAEPVDGSLLAFLRIAMGGVLSWELWRYVSLDRPRRYYGTTDLHFTYFPFDWVRPLPDPWLTYLFVALSLAAAVVGLGVYFRPACWVLCAGLAYIFLLDRTYYLNHWYLSVLLAFLLALTPADRVWSLDARFARSTARVVPRWTIQIFRFQIGIVYFVGGLAKLEEDWLEGRPLGIWVRGDTDVPVIGPLLEHQSTVVVMAVLATVFDLVIVAAMLNGRTRRFAYPIALGFHLLNSRLFSIGMFPWMMMLITVVFFPTDFPRRMLENLREGRHRVLTAIGGVVMGVLSTWVPDDPFPVITIVGVVAGAIAAHALVAPELTVAAPLDDQVVASSDRSFAKPVRWLLVGWIVVQVLLPVRPYVYPGNAGWSEEGHLFAWRMLLRTKDGVAEFTAYERATGRTWTLDPDDDLTDDQVEAMAKQPELMVQYAHWIEDRERARGSGDLAITVRAEVEFNDHPAALIVDPTVDLTEVDRPWLPPAEWIRDAPDD